MRYNSHQESNAVKYFNKYICLRDLQKNDNGEIFGICISSGRKWTAILNFDGQITNGREWCASHYHNADKFASVRFDERNVNGQFQSLNRYSAGDKSNYEPRLRQKIGDAEFEQLNIDRQQIKKYFSFDYQKIADKYRLKCKEERKRLGIKI